MAKEISDLYSLSQQILEALPDKFVKLYPHDNADWEDSDSLWFQWTPDSDYCEGQYIDITPETKDGTLWAAHHDYAMKFGGHSTEWRISGSPDFVFKAVVQYMKSKTINQER